MGTQLRKLDMALPIGSLEAYVHWVNRIPVLSADEERVLSDRFYKDGDLDVARKLVMSHLRFVVRIAKKYSGYGLAEADLIQEGNVGLMKAVKRFNPAVGVRLLTFAVHWIKSEIHEFILRNWRIVKVATTKAQRKLFFNLRRLSKNYGWLCNQEVARIADDLKVKKTDVETMEARMNSADASLEAEINGDSKLYSLLDVLEDNRFKPDVIVEQQRVQRKTEEILHAALGTLNARSLDILQSRWLTQEKEATLQELATKYNISAERVRQLEKQALAKLKKIIMTGCMENI